VKLKRERETNDASASDTCPDLLHTSIVVGEDWTVWQGRAWEVRIAAPEAGQRIVDGSCGRGKSLWQWNQTMQ
jgi:hypothetical protein